MTTTTTRKLQNRPTLAQTNMRPLLLVVVTASCLMLGLLSLQTCASEIITTTTLASGANTPLVYPTTTTTSSSQLSTVINGQHLSEQARRQNQSQSTSDSLAVVSEKSAQVMGAASIGEPQTASTTTSETKVPSSTRTTQNAQQQQQQPQLVSSQQPATTQTTTTTQALASQTKAQQPIGLTNLATTTTSTAPATNQFRYVRPQSLASTSTTFAPTTTTATATATSTSEPEQAMCQHNNRTYSIGQRWNDDCLQTCECVLGPDQSMPTRLVGISACQPRCPTYPDPPGDRCKLVRANPDDCCLEWHCEVEAKFVPSAAPSTTTNSPKSVSETVRPTTTMAPNSPTTILATSLRPTTPTTTTSITSMSAANTPTTTATTIVASTSQPPTTRVEQRRPTTPVATTMPPTTTVITNRRVATSSAPPTREPRRQQLFPINGAPDQQMSAVSSTARPQRNQPNGLASMIRSIEYTTYNEPLMTTGEPVMQTDPLTDPDDGVDPKNYDLCIVSVDKAWPVGSSWQNGVCNQTCRCAFRDEPRNPLFDVYIYPTENLKENSSKTELRCGLPPKCDQRRLIPSPDCPRPRLEFPKDETCACPEVTCTLLPSTQRQPQQQSSTTFAPPAPTTTTTTTTTVALTSAGTSATPIGVSSTNNNNDESTTDEPAFTQYKSCQLLGIEVPHGKTVPEQIQPRGLSSTDEDPESCDRTCTCEDGKIVCEPICPPVTDEPPSDLICPQPQVAVQLTVGCCSKWVCQVAEPYALQSFKVVLVNASHVEFRIGLPDFALGQRGRLLLRYASAPADSTTEIDEPPADANWTTRAKIRTEDGSFAKRQINYVLTENLQPGSRYWFKVMVLFETGTFQTPLESPFESIVVPPSSVRPSVSVNPQQQMVTTTTAPTTAPTRAQQPMMTIEPLRRDKPTNRVTISTTQKPTTPSTTTTTTTTTTATPTTTTSTTTTTPPPPPPTSISNSETPSSTTTTSTTTTTTTTTGPPQPVEPTNIRNADDSTNITKPGVAQSSDELQPCKNATDYPLIQNHIEEVHAPKGSNEILNIPSSYTSFLTEQIHNNLPIQRYAWHLLAALSVMTVLFVIVSYLYCKKSRVIAPITSPHYPYHGHQHHHQSAYDNPTFTKLVSYYANQPHVLLVDESNQNFDNLAKQKNLEVDKSSPLHHHTNDNQTGRANHRPITTPIRLNQNGQQHLI